MQELKVKERKWNEDRSCSHTYILPQGNINRVTMEGGPRIRRVSTRGGALDWAGSYLSRLEIIREETADSVADSVTGSVADRATEVIERSCIPRVEGHLEVEEWTHHCEMDLLWRGRTIENTSGDLTLRLIFSQEPVPYNIKCQVQSSPL